MDVLSADTEVTLVVQSRLEALAEMMQRFFCEGS